MRNIDRNNHIWKRSIAAVAILLATVMTLSSCAFARFTVDAVLGNGEDKVSFPADESVGDSSSLINENESEILENREEITLPKSESLKGEGKLTSAGQAYNTVSEVYYAVADSVVEITTETVQTSIWMGQYISTGAGSGVIIDKSGLIVTNNHVIEGANNVIVRLSDGSEYEAALIGADAAADLAVIKISVTDKELQAAHMGCSADLVVGEDVVAIGNPLGSLGGTLTTGIISATERSISIDGEEMVLLQTNAAINPGNSGGGLFNMAGQLIGVVNAKAAGEDIEGLGFAIPVDFAHAVMEDLINYGYVRGVVDHGLILLDVTEQNLPSAYRKYGITSIGVVILDSQYSDELEYGDTIVSINGQEINSSADVQLITKACSVGDVITVSVMRGKEIVSVELKLHEKVPEKVSFN